MNVLVTADALLERLGEDGLVLVDTRPEAAWRAGTIPGAILVNVYDYFIPASDEAGIAAMAAAAAAAWRAAGLDGARVVFFEEDTGMRSPRGLWFHELLGRSGGAILDGGLAAWRAAGGRVAPGTAGEWAVAGAAAPSSPFRRDLVASTAEMLNPPVDWDILDTRRRSEFEGTYLHECCARPGRIPGAKFLFFEDMLAGGRYRAAAEIRARAAAAGLSPERTVVTYCHRGARAATALYGLRLAGFRDVRIFVGSWHEWAADPALPALTGG